MRVFLLLLCCTVVISESFSQGAEFSFDKTELEFGKAEGGDVLNFTYPFKNTGSEPLIINKISVACTCTKPTWPKYPIMPGKTDSILVEFNTKTVWGAQNKEMRIYSNASEGYTSIYFKGSVKKGDYVKEEQKKK